MKTAWRKLAVIGLSILMMFALAVPSAFAAGPVAAKNAVEADATYYQGLKNPDGTKPLTGDPSLTIGKYIINNTGSTSEADTTRPIQGVEFRYAKVGSLYQLTLDNGSTVMAYGVTDAFGKAVGLVAQDGSSTSANYEYTDPNTSVTTYFFLDGETIQNATKAKTAKDLETFLGTTASNPNNVQTDTTDSYGLIDTGITDYGLYLVVETDVSNAKEVTLDAQGQPVGNPVAIAITKVQAPFIVSLPTQNPDDNTWNKDVIANVKNSTATATVEKKIVVGDNENLKDGTETVADTDITHIGDTVHYRLKGTIPPIPSDSSTEIEYYTLTDNISKGLTAVTKADGMVKIDAVRVVGADGLNITFAEGTDKDYTVSALTAISDASEYDGGNQFTIEFTGDGLDKLTQIAKHTSTTKEIYFYYSATVNSDAIIGPNPVTGAGTNVGNPNEVQLHYNTTGGPGFYTVWDKVTHFTFGIDVTKAFDGGDPASVTKVAFRLYRKDGNGDKTYYSFTSTVLGSYHTPTDATDAANVTQLKLDSSKKISIKGLEEGTYYLEEISTVPGYNLLKEPVTVTLTAVGGTNNVYVDPTVETPSDDYQGTLTGDSNNSGVISLTVTNTKGFTLPSTGGAGIWMFVLGGAVVIALGCGYFILTRKKEQ